MQDSNFLHSSPNVRHGSADFGYDTTSPQSENYAANATKWVDNPVLVSDMRNKKVDRSITSRHVTWWDNEKENEEKCYSCCVPGLVPQTMEAAVTQQSCWRSSLLWQPCELETFSMSNSFHTFVKTCEHMCQHTWANTWAWAIVRLSFLNLVNPQFNSCRLFHIVFWNHWDKDRCVGWFGVHTETLWQVVHVTRLAKMDAMKRLCTSGGYRRYQYSPYSAGPRSLPMDTPEASQRGKTR